MSTNWVPFKELFCLLFFVLGIIFSESNNWGYVMDIKKAVLNNLKGRTKEEIKGFIQEVVDSKEESAIPGLGVIFEATWEKLDNEEKDSMMNLVMRGIS